MHELLAVYKPEWDKVTDCQWFTDLSLCLCSLIKSPTSGSRYVIFLIYFCLFYNFQLSRSISELSMRVVWLVVILYNCLWQSMLSKVKVKLHFVVTLSVELLDKKNKIQLVPKAVLSMQCMSNLFWFSEL